ncbi:uncharacterized protein [Macrobrachium rosenbergii]|uniref:uncharacterized protein n=1 Tax=Macrobrachium rosenbergii TaxID=79674 RepID=UPI0034D4AA9C
MCKMVWMTGSCDYTTNVCSSRWYCTCCGSCKETKTNSKCKKAGGRCSTNCTSSEYHAGWISCHHGCCKCCKNKCDGTTCAKGKGYCSPTGICKRGYRPSTTAFCQGFNCTCCVQ